MLVVPAEFLMLEILLKSNRGPNEGDGVASIATKSR